MKVSQENLVCIIKCIDESYFPNISQLQNKAASPPKHCEQITKILNSDHTLNPPEALLGNTDIQAPAAPESGSLFCFISNLPRRFQQLRLRFINLKEIFIARLGFSST